MTEQERIIYTFKKQAEKNVIYRLDKEIFILSLEFSLEDWRRMRTKKYWEKRDAIENLYEQKNFILLSMREYLDFEKE